MGWGVGTAWLIDTFNSCFFLSFTLHFYYLILFEFIPALFFTGWSGLQATVAVEVVVVFLNMIMPV